jgi:hypothetical protein
MLTLGRVNELLPHSVRLRPCKLRLQFVEVERLGGQNRSRQRNNLGKERLFQGLLERTGRGGSPELPGRLRSIAPTHPRELATVTRVQ